VERHLAAVVERGVLFVLDEPLLRVTDPG